MYIIISVYWWWKSETIVCSWKSNKNRDKLTWNCKDSYSVYCYRSFRPSVSHRILGIFHKHLGRFRSFFSCSFYIGWEGIIPNFVLFLKLWKGFSWGVRVVNLIIIFIYSSIFMKFRTLLLTVIARWFNQVETKISERDHFSILREGGNLKIFIIFIITWFFMKFGTLFLDTITAKEGDSIGLKLKFQKGPIIARWFNLSLHNYFHFCWMGWKRSAGGAPAGDGW